MSAWQESVTAQVRADLDGLLDVVVPLAQRRVAQRGSFTPFSATMTTDGELVVHDDDAAADARRGVAAVLAGLYASVRAHRDEARAAAFVAPMTDDDTDAIRVELEHAEGAWMTVVMPYSRKRFSRAVAYQPLVSTPAVPHVWTARRAP